MKESKESHLSQQYHFWTEMNIPYTSIPYDTSVSQIPELNKAQVPLHLHNQKCVPFYIIEVAIIKMNCFKTNINQSCG